MAIDDVFYNRQAQSGSALFAASVGVYPVESFCESRQVQRVNALTPVDDLDLNRRAFQDRFTLDLGHTDSDLLARTTVFDRVFHQVMKNLRQLIGIGPKPNWPLGHLQPDPYPASCRGVPMRDQRRFQKSGDVDLVRRTAPLFRLHAAERKKVADQPDHPARLTLHDAKETIPGGGIVARRPPQRFDEADQGGERCAQFVADIGDEVTPHRPGLFDRGQILERDQNALPHIAFHRRESHGKMSLAAPGDQSEPLCILHLPVQCSFKPAEEFRMPQKRAAPATLRGRPEDGCGRPVGYEDPLIGVDEGDCNRQRIQYRSHGIELHDAFPFRWARRLGRKPVKVNHSATRLFTRGSPRYCFVCMRVFPAGVSAALRVFIRRRQSMSADKADPAERLGKYGAFSDTFDSDGAPMRVLAVDVRPAIVQVIRNAGADVIDASYASLTLALLAQWTPDAVVAPLLGTGFDILDLGQRLEKLAFGGQLYALAGPIPDVAAIVRELRDHCPGLVFDVISLPAG